MAPGRPADRRTASRIDVSDIADLRDQARRRLPRAVFDYVDGGADDEVTLDANRSAFRRLTWRPQVLDTRGGGPGTADGEAAGRAHDTSLDGVSVDVFGQSLRMPIVAAPCGGVRLVHPEGDCGVASGAAAAGTLSIVPSFAGFSLEHVMATAPGPHWFQLYNFADRGLVESLIGRAAAAGYRALVCTLDTPVFGNRERDLRNGYTSDLGINLGAVRAMGAQVARRPRWAWRFWRDGMPLRFPNLVPAAGAGGAPMMSELAAGAEQSFSPTWDQLGWIRRLWPGPLVVKGVVTPADAKRAVAAGVDGIIVSNHGGRQLDGLPAAIDVLPSVVAACGSDTVVMLDGGIRRGSDVAKALARGARLVCVGRPAIWGLSAGGSQGVAGVFDLLRAELVRTIHLLGRTGVGQLDPSCLAP